MRGGITAFVVTFSLTVGVSSGVLVWADVAWLLLISSGVLGFTCGDGLLAISGFFYL